MSHAKGYDYYAFCDQDDVWMKDKLITAVNCLDKMNEDAPLLYCSNLNVVDENLRFCRICHTEKYDLSNKYLGLVELFAVGCTEVFNQRAIDMALHHWSVNCLMHDSWLFMTCNFFGEVYYDEASYINYRQHGGNVIGAQKNFWGKVKASSERISVNRIQPRKQNALALLDAFSSDLCPKDLKKVQKVAYYQDSLMNRLRLITDFSIRAASFKNDLKYRLLIIIGII